LKGGEAMVYIIEPNDLFIAKACKPRCYTLACAIKPLYGIGP